MLCVFGRQLKLFRERAGLDRAGLGSLTGYSASTIASFEQARRIPRLLEAELVRVSGIGGAGVYAHQAAAEVDVCRVGRVRGVVRVMRACSVSRWALTGAAIRPSLLVESVVTSHQHNEQPGEPTRSPHQAVFQNSLTCLVGRPMDGPRPGRARTLAW